ncbi:fibroin heavy chain-like [Pipra filicauda]|uniref:Fibroin heavy chain-like n=1 Tax=Pipra filicauda TaxID=649802 RepID=A0A7R5L0A3_9PASS|nr:fibroin heavy chain-like [Pipra filicauda]
MAAAPSDRRHKMTGEQRQLPHGSRARSPPLALGTPGRRPGCRARGPSRAQHSEGSGAAEGGERGCRERLGRAGSNGAGTASAARSAPSPGGRGAALGRGKGKHQSSAPSSGPPLPASGLLFAR